MVRSRVLSAIFCARRRARRLCGPFSRGYYAAGCPYVNPQLLLRRVECMAGDKVSMLVHLNGCIPARGSVGRGCADGPGLRQRAGSAVQPEVGRGHAGEELSFRKGGNANGHHA